MAVETLVDVAGWKAHAQRTFVDILHTVFPSRHDVYSCTAVQVDSAGGGLGGIIKMFQHPGN